MPAEISQTPVLEPQNPFARADYVPPERRRELDPDRLRWLESELGDWRTLGLIDSSQGASIRALYETSRDHAAQQANRFFLTLMSLAGLLTGAAVLLLVGYNWQLLSGGFKIGLIFGSILAAHGVGILLQNHWRRPQLANVAFFVGCLLYGAGIWLVAQVFHIEAHYPDGFFWWAAGVLPFALLLDSILLHALLVGVLGLWITTEISHFGHLGAVLFGWRVGIPNGCYAAVVMSALGLAVCYRRQSYWGAALYVPLLAYWTIWQPIAWRFEVNPVFFVGSVGALLLIAGESHSPRDPFAIPYRLFGALLFGGSLAPLSNIDFYRWSHWRGAGIDTTIGLVTFLLLATGGVFAGCEALRYYWLEQGKADKALRLDDLRKRQWMPLLLAVTMIVLMLLGLSPTENDRSQELFLPALFLANGAMLSLAIWLIWVGLRDHRVQPFAGGTLYFLLWVLLRYIDLGDVSMVGAAVLFLLCAAVLAGMAWYWVRRSATGRVSPAVGG